jgi:Orsellinic acid/F9775 biosynthesis cluster protein D
MDPFHYYSDYRVLVCKSCQHAVQPTRIAAHLRGSQHKLPRQQSEEIANQYKDIQLADPITEQVIPITVITPIEYLPIYHDGLACNQCNYICRSRDWMQRHQREVHNVKIGRGRRLAQPKWTTVWCQQFFTGVGRHFFQVQQTNQWGAYV